MTVIEVVVAAALFLVVLAAALPWMTGMFTAQVRNDVRNAAFSDKQVAFEAATAAIGTAVCYPVPGAATVSPALVSAGANTVSFYQRSVPTVSNPAGTYTVSTISRDVATNTLQLSQVNAATNASVGTLTLASNVSAVAFSYQNGAGSPVAATSDANTLGTIRGVTMTLTFVSTGTPAATTTTTMPTSVTVALANIRGNGCAL